MIYVLIVVFGVGNPSYPSQRTTALTQEFNTEKACVNARLVLNQSKFVMIAECLPKGL